MSAKAKTVAFGDNYPRVVFHCPACGHAHSVPYTKQRPHTQNPILWFFDENYESPTIEPSLRVMQSEGKTDCHVVITNGMLNYCADSAHAYAGKSIPMTDWKEPEGDSDLPDESLPEDASDE